MLIQKAINWGHSSVLSMDSGLLVGARADTRQLRVC